MESEKRKKKAIEEMMTRELEKTVGHGGRQKRHHDDREKSHSYKRYRHDDDVPRGRGRDYDSYRDDYRDDYEGWDRRGRYPYDNR